MFSAFKLLFWIFKMVFKLIGTVLMYLCLVPILIIFLPFYLPYALIKDHKNRNKVPLKRTCQRAKDADDLWWIDKIEEFDAFMED